MSRQLDPIFRSTTDPDQHKSFRTIRSSTNYNLSDFLPPTRDQSTSQNIKHKDKIATEPADKSRQAMLNEQIRKSQILQQERVYLKTELDNFKKQIELMRQENEQKDKELQNLKAKISTLQSSRRPKLSFEKNSVHYQLLPIFKQSYQVSVQTDPALEIAHGTRDTKAPSTSNNCEMQHIYQKLDSLKMGKRKGEAPKMPTTTVKAERPRAITSIWGSNDKENLMRATNLLEIGRTNEKPGIVREEAVDLYCMPLQAGQRLLNQYLDQPFI